MENQTARDPDIVDKAFGVLDHALDVFHDKVLRPLFLTGRTIAFGFILLNFVVAVLCVLLVGLIRILNVYAFAGVEWITYLLVGSLLLLSGLVVWRRRSSSIPQRKSS